MNESGEEKSLAGADTDRAMDAAIEDAREIACREAVTLLEKFLKSKGFFSEEEVRRVIGAVWDAINSVCEGARPIGVSGGGVCPLGEDQMSETGKHVRMAWDRFEAGHREFAEMMEL